jgi:hypothetical protein
MSNVVHPAVPITMAVMLELKEAKILLDDEPFKSKVG